MTVVGYTRRCREGDRLQPPPPDTIFITQSTVLARDSTPPKTCYFDNLAKSVARSEVFFGA